LDELNENKYEGKLIDEQRENDENENEDLLKEEQRLTQKVLSIVNQWDFQKPICEPHILSPKVIKLVQILDCFQKHSDEFCGIVFVERRHTANVLHYLMQEIGTLRFVKSGVLVGHGSSEEGDVQMKFKEQNKIINSFRDGKINLLIATNVAEE